MGQGSSTALSDVYAWIAAQQALNPPPPTPTQSLNKTYMSVVKYAYANPTKSEDYLSDIQSRFFNKECHFRWSWSEERPKTDISNLLSTVEMPATPGDAVEAYRKVVEAFVYNFDNCTDVLNDMKIRYFDPRFQCAFRNPASPQDYQKDLDPVFR